MSRWLMIVYILVKMGVSLRSIGGRGVAVEEPILIIFHRLLFPPVRLVFGDSVFCFRCFGLFLLFLSSSLYFGCPRKKAKNHAIHWYKNRIIYSPRLPYFSSFSMTVFLNRFLYNCGWMVIFLSIIALYLDAISLWKKKRKSVRKGKLNKIYTTIC